MNEKRTAWIQSLETLTHEQLLEKFAKLTTQADPMNTVVDYNMTLDMLAQVRSALLSRMS